jgi:hypothetical protein
MLQAYDDAPQTGPMAAAGAGLELLVHLLELKHLGWVTE